VFTGDSFNVQDGGTDEYAATIAVPDVSATMSFSYTYRVSFDGGASFTYGDLDGAGSGPDLAFDPDNLGLLTVSR
jgi:hypothetical protein